MSATKRELLSVSYVTDHDCGNYSIGEIDFGVSGTLRKYLIDHGHKGKKDIVNALAYLIYEVEREFRSIDAIERWAQQSTQAPAAEGAQDDE
jgi:hypothetical protein